MITSEELTIIEARAEAAEPGPWKDEVTDDGFLRVSVNPDDVNGICGFGDLEETGAEDHFNAIFIASARTDVPLLLTEIKRLRVIEQAARKYLTTEGPDTYPAYQELRRLILSPRG